MTDQQPAKPRPRPRGAIARPLDSLVFLLPLMAFYEIASWYATDRLVAFDMIHGFLQLFGQVGSSAPALAVVVILLATHYASGQPWKIRWKRVGLMYVESVVLALPLLVLMFRLAAVGEESGSWRSLIDEMALSIGAAVYEELVFRLVFLSVVVIVGVDLLHLSPPVVAAAAVILSSLAFSMHHYEPIGSYQFDPVSFGFRAVAGAYLAIVFWYRGYGPAAGCHAAYNVIIGVWNA